MKELCRVEKPPGAVCGRPSRRIFDLLNSKNNDRDRETIDKDCRGCFQIYSVLTYSTGLRVQGSRRLSPGRQKGAFDLQLHVNISSNMQHGS